MKNAFANKISYFILTFIFLIITASFLFSNFDNFSMGSAGQVASVDGTPITTKEYSIALNRQIDFFTKMMGGSGMTQKQLEEMGIKQSVLNGLIQQKLMLNTAEQLGIIISLTEVKNEIKSMPYFKTKEQFDVNLYRNMLQSNGYTPTQFEELVGNDLKQKKLEEFFNSTLVSENYVRDILKFKNNQVSVHGLKIGRQALAPLVSVSEQEVKDYLSKQENQKNLEAAYKENFATYNKPEEIKASHILIQADDETKALSQINAIRAKVNQKNFSDIAKKETQDPTGKANGGDLGWFSAGRMVPEFEKVAFGMRKGEISAPVKTQFGYHIIYLEDKKAAETKSLDSVKAELARMEIQKTKAQDLDKLLKTTSEQIAELFNKNDIASVEALNKKVNGQLFKNVDINQFDQSIDSQSLSAEEADQIFKASPGSVLNFGNPGTIFLVKIIDRKTAPEKTPEQIKAEIGAQSQAFSRKVRDELVKSMNSKAKVVTNPSLL
jgi:peptidyl-prolyl cis-trans isomerase D